MTFVLFYDGATTMASYTGLVFKEPETDYGVHIPDLPGCITAGKTMDEALTNAMHAVAFHADMLARDSDDIPYPRSIEDLKSDPEFVQDIADGGILIQIPLLSASSAKKRVEVQMEANLLDAIDERSKTLGITRTAFINEANKKMLMAG